MKIIFLLLLTTLNLLSQADIVWERIETPVSDGSFTGNGFSSFYIDKQGSFYIMGNWADNAVSFDKGETWKILDNGDSYYDLRSLNDGRLITELNTKYYYSEDSAKSWSEIILPDYFIQGFGSDDSGKMWVGAAGGLVFTNNLTDWNIIDEIEGTIHCLEIRGEQILAGGFNVGFDEEKFGSKGYLYYSNDGGNSWDKMLLENEWFEQALIFDENSMVVSVRREGGNGRSFRTNNGGDSWESISLNDVVVGFTKVNQDTAFAVLANSGPYMTIDKGQTWQPIRNGINSATNRFRLPVSIHPDGDIFVSDLTGAVWKATIKINDYNPNTLLAPILQSPADKSVINNSIAISWKDTQADEYELMISDNNDFQNSVSYKITQNELNDLDLERAKTYFWKVRSLKDKKESTWSLTWSFTFDEISSVMLKTRNDVLLEGTSIKALKLKSNLAIYNILGNKLKSYPKGYSGIILDNSFSGIFFIEIGNEIYKHSI